MKHVIAAVLLVAASVLPAAASPITFTAILTGLAEATPNASPGTGFAAVTIDQVAHTMRVQVSFSGLLAAVVLAHIQVVNGPGDPNTADTIGPVATASPFAGFPLGVMAGTYDHTFDTTLASAFRLGFVIDAGSVALAEQALFDGIIDGRAYLNLHSAGFLSGEIRGFLVPETTAVPEPSAVLLVGTGLLATLAYRRTRTGRR